MPTRETPPVGAPCWVDLMSSDVERSRAFYGELFGWESEDPNDEFGGYFNFTKDGVRIAGGMPRMPEAGDLPDVWSVYLAVENAEKTVETATAAGSQVIAPAMAVADLGSMAVITDPGGASIGMWQPGLHQGFGVYDEPDTPAWFELHTRAYDDSVAFYRDVFGWDAHEVPDIPGADFRYTTLGKDEASLAGIIDNTSFTPEGTPAHWTVY